MREVCGAKSDIFLSNDDPRHRGEARYARALGKHMKAPSGANPAQSRLAERFRSEALLEGSRQIVDWQRFKQDIIDAGQDRRFAPV